MHPPFAREDLRTLALIFQGVKFVVANVIRAVCFLGICAPLLADSILEPVWIGVEKGIV